MKNLDEAEMEEVVRKILKTLLPEIDDVSPGTKVKLKGAIAEFVKKLQRLIRRSGKSARKRGN